MKRIATDTSNDRAALGFEHAAARSFAFLSRSGFELLESVPTILRYGRGDIEINIYHGRRSYELGFEVVHRKSKYSLSELIRAIDPETASMYRNFVATNAEGLARGLANLALLAQKFGKRIFENDEGFFARLEDQRKTWSKEYALDVLETQLRPKAREAFRVGQYKQAAELYQRIRPRLTDVEVKMLATARRRSKER